MASDPTPRHRKAFPGMCTAALALVLTLPAAGQASIATRDGLALNAALSRCLDYSGCSNLRGGRVENDGDTSRYVYHFATTFCGAKRVDIIVRGNQVALYSSLGNC